MKRLLAPILAVAAIALAGCAPLLTQSPGQGLSPVNAVSDGEDKHLMLFGHDVVSYFTEGRHRAGSPAHKSVHKGVTFRFASAEHKKLFDEAPAKYIPQYGGYCANGIAYGIPWGGDADTWRIIDGRLYIFGGAGSRDAFLLDERGNLALAERYWKEEVEGSNAFWQRAKRLVFRVPHYKTGEQLAAEVARAKGGK
ncbi:MAG: YHS domain-containing (seleno)protein [Burkholderiales bacterium]